MVQLHRPLGEADRPLGEADLPLGEADGPPRQADVRLARRTLTKNQYKLIFWQLISMFKTRHGQDVYDTSHTSCPARRIDLELPETKFFMFLTRFGQIL